MFFLVKFRKSLKNKNFILNISTQI
uniref:Uncharacterized protein n=1 Tax=Anguilla anguilla TaxID=7936 RepID=A0A0E9QWG8_ANGAN